MTLALACATNTGLTQTSNKISNANQTPSANQSQTQTDDVDAVKVSAQYYTVLLENERVCVLDYRTKPGDQEKMHAHPPSVVYSLDNYKFRNNTSDGKTVELEAKTGEVIWRDRIIHAAENIGNSEAHALVIELKDPPAARP